MNQWEDYYWFNNYRRDRELQHDRIGEPCLVTDLPDDAVDVPAVAL